jgi:hypothetical protein
MEKNEEEMMYLVGQIKQIVDSDTNGVRYLAEQLSSYNLEDKLLRHLGNPLVGYASKQPIESPVDENGDAIY